MKKNKIKSIALLCGVLGVLIIMTIYFCLLYLDNEDDRRLNKISEDRFAIIVLPDTQKYSEGYPIIFSMQTQWIADNKDGLNIKFVIHEGDIVDDADKLEQWNMANESLSILDKTDIPYSVIRGNHDKGTELYKSYFPAERFSDESWWGGEYKNNTNNYQLLKIQNNDFLFISLDFCPDNEEINWADEVLKNYSERKAILTTHAYLDNKAERNVHVCGNTTYIWNLIKKHENLQIVLCGHVHAEARITDLNDAGKPVHQLLADYQTEQNGGNGWLRILEFSPSENKIYVKTYSPYLKAYQTDKDSEFVLDYEF